MASNSSNALSGECGLDSSEEHLELEAFNAAFGVSVTYEIMQRARGQPAFIGWFREREASQRAAALTPDAFLAAGITPSEYQPAIEQYRSVREGRKALADEIARVSTSYRKEMATLAARSRATLTGVFDNPFVQVIDGGFQHLEPAETLWVVSGESEDQRKARTRITIAAARVRWVVRARMGLPPLGPIYVEKWDSVPEWYTTELLNEIETRQSNAARSALDEFNADQRKARSPEIATLAYALRPKAKNFADLASIDRLKMAMDVLAGQFPRRPSPPSSGGA